MAPRLTAEFWVQAYLTRLRLANIPVYVTARGDATAGGEVLQGRVVTARQPTDEERRALDLAWRVTAPIASKKKKSMYKDKFQCTGFARAGGLL